jgi:hypothetical protein
LDAEVCGIETGLLCFWPPILNFRFILFFFWWNSVRFPVKRSVVYFLHFLPMDHSLLHTDGISHTHSILNLRSQAPLSLAPPSAVHQPPHSLVAARPIPTVRRRCQCPRMWNRARSTLSTSALELTLQTVRLGSHLITNLRSIRGKSGSRVNPYPSQHDPWITVGRTSCQP